MLSLKTLRLAGFLMVSCLVAIAGYGQNTDTSVRIRSILLEGNKVTRPQIILRELTFAEGDTMDSDQWSRLKESSRNNLLNTSLFNYVTIDSIPLDAHQWDVRIHMEERWYTWPMPIFELADRNFNVWWKTKDLSRTYYGLYLVRYNFRGRKETVTFRVRLGYSEQYRLAYSIPYINKKQTSGLQFSFAFSRNREVTYNSEAGIPLFYKDEGLYPRQNLSADLAYTHRKNIYTTHSFLVKYSNIQISDTLMQLNPEYLGEERKHLEYMSLSYNFRHDHRDFKPYPLKGYFIDLELVKMGLGVFADQSVDHSYAVTTIKGFKQLSNRWFAAGSFSAKLSDASRQPFVIQRGLGYGNLYVRAYELKVADGQNFWLTRGNLKFALIQPFIKTFSFIPAPKFNKVSLALYANVFCDAGYVRDPRGYYDGPLTNTLMTGYGAGLDLVTYYDKVLRIEYAFDRFGENGIFLHFTAPI
ncbi:MAG: hypothetical protein H6585_14130 [Flavobacteriales bacterium]|nr:hypothetical protein [Flavobacteriales bacterium]MCB9449468.1 hypothetical protein [Flavobacteriales bacterium]